MISTLKKQGAMVVIDQIKERDQQRMKEIEIKLKEQQLIIK